MGTVVELYPTRGRKVFASQVYDIAYPDIVALDMKCKEVVVMEMTSATDLRGLFDKRGRTSLSAGWGSKV